jgi:hypothetical protein
MTFRTPLFLVATWMFLTAAVVLSSENAFGAMLTLDFEGETPGSTTPPTGWSLVTAAGSPTYATTAAGQGSNGSGGSSGLAGRVSTTAVIGGTAVDLPSGYLVNTTSGGVFDLNFPLSITVDLRIVHEDAFDDVAIVVGDVANGLTATAGKAFSVKFIEQESLGIAHAINNGQGTAAGRLDTSALNGVVDDTWYRATITWTPTSGLTGNIGVTLNNFTSNIVTMSATGFTFNAANGEVGFGSVNDTGRFDNIVITGTLVPEPSSLAMLAFGMLTLWLFRKRKSDF